MMYLIAGNNLFGQWTLKELVFKTFTPFSYDEELFQISTSNIELLHISWSYNIFLINQKMYICGSYCGKENQIKLLTLPEDCSENDIMVTGSDYKIILINTKTFDQWIIDIENGLCNKKLKSNIEKPITVDEKIEEDILIKMKSTNNNLLLLTNNGHLYCGLLPSLVDTSHCLGKICDISSGYEHHMILTDSGNVYSWGNGWRLQLGHGDLSFLDKPKEIAALAGIKIKKIVSGGWHSLALSVFGDVYAWGWNDTGQLGVDDSEMSKDVNSYSIPKLVDLYDHNGSKVDLNVIDIACGSRHSILLLEDYSVWGSGSNKYSQLGLATDKYKSVTRFKMIFQCCSEVSLMASLWTSVIKENKLLPIVK